jgi:hypothetical protein
MATIEGFVNRLSFNVRESAPSAFAFVWVHEPPVGEEQGFTYLLTVTMRWSRSEHVFALKTSILEALTAAMLGRLRVTVTFEDEGSEITALLIH